MTFCFDNYLKPVLLVPASACALKKRERKHQWKLRLFGAAREMKLRSEKGRKVLRHVEPWTEFFESF
jgi:hypothetical protein